MKRMAQLILLLLLLAPAAAACVSSAAGGALLSAGEARSTSTVAPSPQRSVACSITQPIQDQPPKDPHADPFGFKMRV